MLFFLKIGSHFAALAGLEHTELSFLCLLMLGLKACATMSSFVCLYLYQYTRQNLGEVISVIFTEKRRALPLGNDNHSRLKSVHSPDSKARCVLQKQGTAR